MGCFKVYILLTLLFFIKGFSTFTYNEITEGCGETMSDIELSPNTSDTTHITNFPWIARLGVILGNRTIFYCSGSLVHPRFVLTAAHCGQQSEIVRLGDSNLSHEKDCFCGICAPPYQDIGIEEIIYSDHCRLTNTNDLSIVVLKKPANISSFVRPICLPNPEKRFSIGTLKEKRTFTAGWGVTYSGWGAVDGSLFKAERNLEYLEVPVLEREMCKGNFTRDLEENELCVGYKSDEPPCVADSGGSLSVSMETEDGSKKRYIVGVASHNLQTCQNGIYSPVIYTDVCSHINWIIKTINQSWQAQLKKSKARK